MSDYQSQRLTAYARDKGRCVVCLGHGQQCHHRQGRGGKDPHRLSNLLTVCAEDHRRIHGNPAWAYENGYMVPRLGIRTPEDTPVLTRSGWVLYDNDGGTTATEPMKETA